MLYPIIYSGVCDVNGVPTPYEMVIDGNPDVEQEPCDTMNITILWEENELINNSNDVYE